MSIVAKCTCGKSVSGWCAGVKGCENTLLDARSIMQFFSIHECTDDEKRKLKAFLFALRHNDVDLNMLERIINKYSHLL